MAKLKEAKVTEWKTRIQGLEKAFKRLADFDWTKVRQAQVEFFIHNPVHTVSAGTLYSIINTNHRARLDKWEQDFCEHIQLANENRGAIPLFKKSKHMILEEMIIDYWMTSNEHNQLRIHISELDLDLSRLEVRRLCPNNLVVSYEEMLNRIPWNACQINNDLNDAVVDALKELLHR